MMRRRFALALTIAISPAMAEDGGETPFSLRDYPERMQATVEACEAAPDSSACRVQLMSALPTTIEALSFLGYESTYADSAPLLRDMAAFPKPEIQAAAIYALARLGPTADDLPVLREALLSDVPGVRRAAIGALKRTADTLAQELVARAKPVPGDYYEPDLLPFDPAAMGIARWPDGARFLHFQRLRDRGTYVFIAPGDLAGLIAGFEADAGRKAVGMGEIEARFAAYGDLLAPWSERNATLGAVQAVILKDVAAPSENDVAVVALFYEDYALGAPGFAIVRLPGEALPMPRRPVAEAPPAPQGDAAIWYARGAFVPKDGAAEDDIAAWRAVLDSDGVGAAAYLEAFPEGAWRAEADALVAGPKIETDLDIYAETDTINVSWRGVAVSPDNRLELRLSPASDENVYSSIAESNPEVTTAEGAAELKFNHYARAGVYEVRLTGQGDAPLAVAEIRITLAAAKLTLSGDSFKPGAAITVAYAAMAGSPRDLISIAKKGEGPYSTGRITAPTTGAEGSVTLTAPQEPGEYEVRAWFNGESRMRARVPFTVRGPDQPPEITTGEGPAVALAAGSFTANEKILVRYARLPGEGGQYVYLAPAGSADSAYLSYADAKGAEGLAQLELPSEPGDYEARLIVGSKAVVRAPLAVVAPADIALAKLTLEKTSFAPGETIAVAFEGMSGARNDYVAVAEAGSRYRSYISYVYTKGDLAGRAELKAPDKPGAYEIRAFFKDDPRILRGVQTITVTGAP